MGQGCGGSLHCCEAARTPGGLFSEWLQQRPGLDTRAVNSSAWLPAAEWCRRKGLQIFLVWLFLNNVLCPAVSGGLIKDVKYFLVLLLRFELLFCTQGSFLLSYLKFFPATCLSPTPLTLQAWGARCCPPTAASPGRGGGGGAFLTVIPSVSLPDTR